MKKIFEKFRALSETEKAEVNEQFKKVHEDFQAKSKTFLDNLPEKRMVDLNYYRTKILKKKSITKSSEKVAPNADDLLSDHYDDVKEINAEEDDEEEDDEKRNNVAEEEEKSSVFSQSSNSSLVFNNQSLEVFVNKSAKRPEK